MATLSYGVQLGYAEAVVAPARPVAYTYIPDLTGVPALGASPASHQVTTLDQAQHTYIKGLQDIGGTLDFSCVFTEAVIDEIDDVVTLQADDPYKVEWCVEFPSPMSMRAYFTGEASVVFNEAVEVDAPIMGTISIVPSSEIKWEAVA